ncbi:hypothetical protein ABN584_11255 [Gloeocapsa sp. BRSZ]
MLNEVKHLKSMPQLLDSFLACGKPTKKGTLRERIAEFTLERSKVAAALKMTKPYLVFLM